MLNLSEADFAFLKELSYQMNTQDKCSTAYPLFVVYDRVEVPNPEGAERKRKEGYDIDADDLCEGCLRLMTIGDDIEEDCDSCHEDTYHYFDWEDRIQENHGIFFTKKACEEYIVRRRYEFDKPYAYAISAYWSEEMKQVMEIISSITNTSEQSLLR